MKCTECGNTNMQEIDKDFWWCPACNNEYYDDSELRGKISKKNKDEFEDSEIKKNHPRRKNQWRVPKRKGAE